MQDATNGIGLISTQGETGPSRIPARKVVRLQRARCLVDQYIRLISLVAKMPKLARKTSDPADNSGTSGMPPVSGSSLDGAGVELLVALVAEALAEALAVGLAMVLAEPLAGAEALDIAVTEALAAGLAIMLSFIPMSSIPPSFIPRLPALW